MPAVLYECPGLARVSIRMSDDADLDRLLELFPGGRKVMIDLR